MRTIAAGIVERIMICIHILLLLLHITLHYIIVVGTTVFFFFIGRNASDEGTIKFLFYRTGATTVTMVMKRVKDERGRAHRRVAVGRRRSSALSPLAD